MKLVILVVALVVEVKALRRLAQTSYDSSFSRLCPNDEAIYQISSYHNNRREDRRWTFYCSSNYNLYDSGVTWTSYRNSWDRTLNFKCGTNKALVGISSYHSNKKEDRRWRFMCKSFWGIQTKNCRHLRYINNYDGPMSWHLSNTNQVLNGLFSVHSNRREDRVWKPYICDICSVSTSWNAWGQWSRCPRSCTPVGGTASIQRRTRTARNNRPQPLCSHLTLKPQTQTRACYANVRCPVPTIPPTRAPDPVRGGWSCWSAWSTCSNSCGSGHKTRTRKCDSPVPSHGGAACSGPRSEKKVCNSRREKLTSTRIVGQTGGRSFILQSVEDCRRKCTSESSFKCLSYVYNPVYRQCYTSNKKKGMAGVVVKTSYEYRHYTYYELTGICVDDTELPSERIELCRTDYRSDFNRECPPGYAVYGLVGDYSRYTYDRLWQYTCNNYSLETKDTAWTGYENKWGGPLDFKCGSNKALVGIGSQHSNQEEDRRWRFKCKSFVGLKTVKCSYIEDFINSHHHYLFWRIPSTDRILNGLYSIHDNNKEDRIWKPYICELCSVSVSWSTWGPWSTCPQTCTRVGSSPPIQRRQRFTKNDHPQPLCSDIKSDQQTQTRKCNENVTCPGEV